MERVIHTKHQEHQLILEECFGVAKNTHPVMGVVSSDGLMQIIQHAKNNTTLRIHQRVQGKEDKQDIEDKKGKEGKEDKDHTLVLFDNEMDCICFRNLNSNFIQTQIHTEKQSLPNNNLTQIHIALVGIQPDAKAIASLTPLDKAFIGLLALIKPALGPLFQTSYYLSHHYLFSYFFPGLPGMAVISGGSMAGLSLFGHIFISTTSSFSTGSPSSSLMSLPGSEQSK
ncbi:hypothetical protein H5410_013347 [Solanum commersonii]|uniref:Uncharacterized protein n=1 Tax=Solanum commersonii TaxID=4109 RepID=A0A9J6AUW0_SOLCO|nr:hypothetical protein H5410_013347 [Solanum commersonii]